ncbi:MAG: hypothetical protein ACP5E4_03125 [Candidatus Aenigmatarchaeota archaeon]
MSADCCGVMGPVYEDSTPLMLELWFFSDNMRRLLAGRNPIRHMKSELLDKSYAFFEEAERGDEYRNRLSKTGWIEVGGTELSKIREIASDIMDINGEGGYFLDYVGRLKKDVKTLRDGGEVAKYDFLKLQNFFETLSNYTLEMASCGGNC